MVVTDVMGRQQIVTTSFNRSTTLLRKGVNEYVYEAGSLRYGYGMQLRATPRCSLPAPSVTGGAMR